ncbi:MAG: addiction module toxin, HicA family [Armatimonadetes bacterium CG2_30_59_28]|nr:type II toxin-antitoxin system HicA family toxin [Armatimonadota bacterium]OIO95104.1 MAG: addiction module toxin, HicA family [Armatimonadetes bacterium CG2_30_59_28]PIU61244.1 MAG: addiction module toxin, HicA family [Armatimonadetes bacterium CG07_land_8_20_14_0_80_59_28]PIX45908.1 MAG: addiction module toxin, HicA family [Armatimonadetes bacterium CG_4_8_14_3_um_filter_58_9]PIY39353.1 MAG: addiction module toxin, HicA family [Armatimonadetes bacterium CG_4_10_14_3_um_filter_59_10]
MKRQELLKRLTVAGCIFVRSGRRHDLYVNPRTKKMQPVPRHTEVDESLARHILKILTQ